MIKLQGKQRDDFYDALREFENMVSEEDLVRCGVGFARVSKNITRKVDKSSLATALDSEMLSF